MNIGGGGTTGSIPTAGLTVNSGAKLAYQFSSAFTATPLTVSGDLSYASGAVLTLNGTYGANQLTATGVNIVVPGVLAINAGAGGATITGTSGSAGGIVAITGNITRSITTSGNVTFTGTSTSATTTIVGLALGGVLTGNNGTLTFDGTASAAGGYGFENGVSGTFTAGITTFGNVTFKGAGGAGRNADLKVGDVTGNGTITLIGNRKGLNFNSQFNASGNLPYNVNIQTLVGNINGQFASGSDNTGNGNYTVNSAGSIAFGTRAINAGNRDDQFEIGRRLHRDRQHQPDQRGADDQRRDRHRDQFRRGIDAEHDRFNPQHHFPAPAA